MALFHARFFFESRSDWPSRIHLAVHFLRFVSLTIFSIIDREKSLIIWKSNSRTDFMEIYIMWWSGISNIIHKLFLKFFEKPNSLCCVSLTQKNVNLIWLCEFLENCA